MFVRWLVAASVLAATHCMVGASTLRIACEDVASGAEVSVNGKFRGECPLDVQVVPGNVQIKATKVVSGKHLAFEQKLRVGEDVTKRIEVTFDALPTQTSGTPLQVDQAAVARQRYEAELAEYNRSIQACLPKYDVERRRAKQAVYQAYRVRWAACKAERQSYGQDDMSDWIMACGAASWDGEEDAVVFIEHGEPEHRIAEYRVYRDLTYLSAKEWCAQQFTEPRAPN